MNNVDPGKASRVLDLLETATRRGDLEKDEAVSILSSWLADQKRNSSSGCLHSSWPACSTNPDASPPPLPPRRWPQTKLAMMRNPSGLNQLPSANGSGNGVQPSQPPQQQSQKLQQRQQRSPRWLRWLAGCVVTQEVADAAAAAAPAARPDIVTPAPPQLKPEHEYAVYGRAASSNGDSRAFSLMDYDEYTYDGDEETQACGDCCNRRFPAGGCEGANTSSTVDSGVSTNTC